jgi:hypothetical protein
MSISVLAKVKEFTEFWKMWLNELYELEKSVPPFQGDELIPEIKNRYSLVNFFIDREEQEKDHFFTNMTKDSENIPMDLKATYYELNAEIIKLWIRHIGYLRELKFCVEADTVTFSEFEKVLERAFDYFIDTYDGMSGALRCMKIDKSIREILSDEEAQKNHYLQSLEYRNRMIGMYKKGLEDIEAYLNEHASEHDGYRIRLDVSEIIRDVEKAVDKAGEL